MMRHTRKCLLIMAIMALSLALTIPAFAQATGGAPGPGTQAGAPGAPKGGALMPEDVLTPIIKGYDFIRDGKYDAAKDAFATAVKRDPGNPFALNNLAVLQERDGKLNDAMANLKDALSHAADYKDKVVQTCFAGGGCMAVKPVKEAGEKSAILPIIQDNIKKLEAKMAAQKPPFPGTPPASGPVAPPMKTKEEPKKY